MKPFKLKRKSWHYWFASSGDRHIKSGTTICDYFWRVLSGILYRLFALIGLLIVGIAGSALVLTMLVGPVAIWFLTDPDMRQIAATGVIIDIVLLVLIICVLVLRLRRAGDAAQPGFVTLAYRSFKDKVCFKIDLE